MSHDTPPPYPCVCCFDLAEAEAQQRRLQELVDGYAARGDRAVDDRDDLEERLAEALLAGQSMEGQLHDVEGQRDRLQRIVDDWAGDGAEYRHALEHVVDCTEGCDQCRDLAQATLDRTTMGKSK